MSFKVIKPTSSIRQEGERLYSKTFMRLWETGEAPPRIKVEQLLNKQGLLDVVAENQKEEDMRKELRSMELRLRKAKNPDGSKMSLSDGRGLALEMRKLRQKIADVNAGVSQYFNATAESLAALERIMYLVWACTKKEDGTQYWPTFEDYKADNGNEVAGKAMEEVMKLLVGVNTDFEKHLYENSWLIKHGFMNDRYQLLDPKGRVVSEDGKLIDENGNYINEDGNRVDYFGNLLDANGELQVEDGWSDEKAVESPARVP